MPGYRMSKFGDTWHEALTMHEVVMPIREALSAATDRAAEALGLATAGLLKSGYSADVLVLPGNPVQDMRHLGKCVAIYRLGHRVVS
jgi:imidazolonepropionase-like amidohydrolase